jgi:hypothetical protein
MGDAPILPRKYTDVCGQNIEIIVADSKNIPSKVRE